MRKRSILIHGLGLTLRRLPALVWTYVFNLGLAIVFSVFVHHSFSDILDHSLASQRLIGAFDLGTAAEAVMRLHDGPSGHSAFTAAHTGILSYLAIYFLLIPGTLFCYQTSNPARLGTLLQQGFFYFWRFIRITILTLIISGLILGGLIALQNLWATHVDNHIVGLHAFLLRLTGFILIFLVGSALRLYFDLVEVYTVQLGQHLRSSGKPDRRVRRTLGPAFRTLRRNFGRAWGTFLLLTLFGAAAVALTAHLAMHMLAQPRVWPMFLLAQAGLFIMLLTRFWQRGAETSLSLQYPIIDPQPLRVLPIANAPVATNPLHPKHPNWQPEQAPADHIDLSPPIDPLNPIYPAPFSPDDPFASLTHHAEPAPLPDPIPNPEPASPNLDEPDPGVFHHDPRKPQT
ncbi:MAG TPA: hypothetical protein VIX42_11185 [Edaphobacter sp.]